MYKIIGADQKEYGPVSAENIREWIAQRRADGNTLIQAEGQTGWRPLSSFPEFSAVLTTQTTPTIRPSAAVHDIPNYLVFAVFCNICCCPPIATPAIYYSAQVELKASAGDTVGAEEASRKARMWCWIALVVGLPVQGVLIAAQVASFLKGMPQ